MNDKIRERRRVKKNNKINRGGRGQGRRWLRVDSDKVTSKHWRTRSEEEKLVQVQRPNITEGYDGATITTTTTATYGH